VVNGKTIRFLPCFLLAALVVVQATQIVPHTCVGDLPLSTGDAVLDTAGEREDVGSPVCVACALASQCGAAHEDSVPATLPPELEGYIAGDTLPETVPDVAEALLPRPPPPIV
jgi:hypothetical protein